MWDFFGIIIDHLSETFRWFLTGFFLTFVVLIILYKNNLLSKTGPLSFIKKVSYYIFFPLYIGIISWFFSATLIVETKAKELAEITIQKAQDSIFPQFSTYILSLANDWVDIEINSKEELVSRYLEEYNFEKGDYTTKAMHWTLISGLEYIENKAIEMGTVEIGDDKVNFPQLISDYLNDENSASTMPFNYLNGLSNKAVHGYTKSFYLNLV